MQMGWTVLVSLARPQVCGLAREKRTVVVVVVYQVMMGMRDQVPLAQDCLCCLVA
jgi:hypothetical protein